MKNYACFLFFLLALYGRAQHTKYDIQKTYTVQEVLEDINYTEKYLLKFHPDPYRYISEDSLRAFVKAIRLKITKPLNEMQVRFFIKQIVAKIGCGHTDVSSSKAYAKTVIKLSRAIMPLNTYLLDNKKLIVINNLSKDSLIKEGDEISAIDGHPIDTVIKTIFSVYTTDGYNETCKKRGIKYEWFKYYYSFCYGFKPEYTVTFKNAKGKLSTTKLQAISSMKDTLILPKRDSVNYLHKTKTCGYSVTDYTKPIAVIDINGFSGRHWKRFFRRSFKDIRKKQINNLVIDLRDNGGGQINDGLNMLSYLIPKTIRVPFDRRPNLLPFNPHLKMGLGTRLTPLLFTLFFPETIKKGRLRHYFFSFPKHRNAYKGNIYVLINGKSFSMSCIAASYLKYKANATLIGDETGGNIAGSNAIINGSLLLPHTRVKIFVPIYHIYHDISVENNGHGVMPDYKTIYSQQDIMEAVDLDMRKVKELVK
jgi:C-terminal processing protease CtpA/Prc